MVTAAVCEFGVRGQRGDWVDRVILGLTNLGVLRNYGHRHSGATGEVELETAGGKSPSENCDSRDAYFWAERLAELLDLGVGAHPGR